MIFEENKNVSRRWRCWDAGFKEAGMICKDDLRHHMPLVTGRRNSRNTYAQRDAQTDASTTQPTPRPKRKKTPSDGTHVLLGLGSRYWIKGWLAGSPERLPLARLPPLTPAVPTMPACTDTSAPPSSLCHYTLGIATPSTLPPPFAPLSCLVGAPNLPLRTRAAISLRLDHC